MIIAIHVTIALSTLLLTTYNYFKPTKNKLTASYISISATLLSGSYLAFASSANILRTCVTGLMFVTVTSILTYYSYKKLNLLSSEKVSDN